jgi:hypothetical protein
METHPSPIASAAARQRKNFLAPVWLCNGFHIRSAALAIAWVGISMALMLVTRHDLLAVGLPIAIACGMWTLPWTRRYCRLGLWGQMGLYGLLLFFEVLIRLKCFGLEGLANPLKYSPNTSISKLVRPAANVELVYELVPGYRGVYMGKDVRVNAIGCRGPNIAASRTEGTRRIMVFGSSIAFGAGVDESQSYAAIAATTLRQQGQAVEIVNCGLPAAVPALSFARARNMAHDHGATDVVIELAPSNIIDGGSIESTRQAFGRYARRELPISQLEKYSFALAGIYPAAYLRQRIGDAFERGQRMVAMPTPATTTTFVQSEIQKLVDAGKREGYRVFVFLVKGPSSAEPDPVIEQARNQLQVFARTMDLIVADTWFLFAQGEFADNFIVFPGDLHPNAEAHKRFGASLAAALVQN